MRVSRREFQRMIGAGLAGAVLGARGARGTSPEPGGSRKIGYCIIGLGRISMGHFMPALAQSSTSRITGLVSGHREKALAQAQKYGVPEHSIYDYKNMDEIRSNPEIDAVYIALPNSMHAEYAIRSARAGKHVLCEKPMSTSVDDAHRMIAACRAAGKKLMIEYRCLYEPLNLRAVELVRQGRLGSVQAIESVHGFNISPGEWRIDRKLSGGGPLVDVGIYSLSACRYLTGEEPAEIHALSSVVDHDGRFRQVEENLSWTMQFPSGTLACCNTSYGGQMVGSFTVHGSKGWMRLEPAFAYQGQRLKARLAGPPGGQPAEIDETAHSRDPAQFVTVADAFNRCIFEDREPKASGEEGLRDVEWIAKIYESCGLRLG